MPRLRFSPDGSLPGCCGPWCGWGNPGYSNHNGFGSHNLDLPRTQDASHHQDCCIFNRESQPKTFIWLESLVGEIEVIMFEAPANFMGNKCTGKRTLVAQIGLLKKTTTHTRNTRNYSNTNSAIQTSEQRLPFVFLLLQELSKSKHKSSSKVVDVLYNCTNDTCNNLTPVVWSM